MNYCTLFNSQYLSRALALYRSLLACAKDFHLYVFTFDESAYTILKTLQLEHVTVISLQEFETTDLLQVKPTRTIAEYCWTCTSSVILHCLEKFKLKEVCYLDADLYFWQDPALLLEEAKAYSILLTEHRYTKEYDHSKVSGKYCVQFMYFKNDIAGLEALNWWREACLEWCFNRVEPGRFGDQKYLDDWLIRFNNVKVLEHLGGGVAPWNVQQYQISNELSFTLQNRAGEVFPLVFYHFHALKFINNRVDFGAYKLSKEIKKVIYVPYVKALLDSEAQLQENKQTRNILGSINVHCKIMKSFSLTEALRQLKHRISGSSNTYSLVKFRG